MVSQSGTVSWACVSPIPEPGLTAMLAAAGAGVFERGTIEARAAWGPPT
jgi:hypothetical protein